MRIICRKTSESNTTICWALENILHLLKFFSWYFEACTVLDKSISLILVFFIQFQFFWMDFYFFNKFFHSIMNFIVKLFSYFRADVINSSSQKLLCIFCEIGSTRKKQNKDLIKNKFKKKKMSKNIKKVNENPQKRSNWVVKYVSHYVISQ